MRLRVAKKIVSRHLRGKRHYPLQLLEPAALRLLRWPYRPKMGPSSAMTFSWVDKQHRVQPPPADMYDAIVLWELTRRQLWTEFPDGTFVSTIFLGIDHGFGFGEPVWFETAIRWGRETAVVFGKEIAKIDDIRRHHTYEEAKTFHTMVVEGIRTKSMWVEPEEEAQGN